MRESLLEILRCPLCKAEDSFDLTVQSRSSEEVRDATLTCNKCSFETQIDSGVPNLMPNPPSFVQKEADGLARFAELMRSDGWDKQRVLNLPYEENGYWHGQSIAMQQVLDTVPFQPGERILDVGSNTCWASAIFAEQKLEAVALDISMHRMQGLRTAEWWFEEKDLYFERVLATMFDTPFKENSFDYIWCCEVLHHNHRENLFNTAKELFRILKPGGSLIVFNEPLRTIKTPKLNPGKEVEQFDGHEHAYMRHSYRRALKNAGFKVNLVGSRCLPLFDGKDLVLTERTTPSQAFRIAAVHTLRKHKLGHKAYLAYKSYLIGDTSFCAICEK